MPRPPRTLPHALTALLLFCAGTPLLAQQPDSLRITWTNPDHPSAIYNPKSTGTVAILVENPTAAPLPLAGSITFGPHADNPKDFKPLSVTPITPATLAAGERATVTINFQFANVGPYDLRFTPPAAAGHSSTLLQNPGNATLECIFAPRAANETRWLAQLPKQAATISNYLPDLATQTGVHRFLLDERFAFDLEHNVGLAAGASLGASEQQIDAMFQDAAKSHTALLLRVAVPINADVDPRLFTAFHEYIDNAVRRAAGALQAIAVIPEGSPAQWSPEERAVFRRFYLAAYEAAKSRDKSLLMLGAGTAQLTRELLANDGLIKYVDALAITDAAAQPQLAAALGKLPLWFLPPPGAEPPAAAIQLAEDGAVITIPAPAADHGATAHLLGGAAFYQKLSPASFPYVAAFQGDGYAVAAVAGQSANTPLDDLYPLLQKSHTTIAAPDDADPNAPPYPNLEVADEPDALRVIDTAGAPVDCRHDDTLFVPAAEKPVYILAAGSAEDLMSLLRVANPNHLPVADPALLHTDAGPVLRLKNLTPDDLHAKLRLIADDNTTLVEKQVVIPAQQPLETPIPESEKPLTIELTTSGVHALIQRTKLPKNP